MKPTGIAACLEKFNLHRLGILHVGAGMLEEAELYKELGFSRVVWIEASSEYQAERQAIADHFGQALFTAVLDNQAAQNVKFYATSSPSCGSLLPLGTHRNYYPDIQEIGIVLVETITGSQFLEEHREAKECNVLSVDTQGTTARVLTGFGDCLEQFDAVFAESFLEDLYIGGSRFIDVDNLLWNHGFFRVDTWVCSGQGWGEGFWMKVSLL